MSSPPRLRGWSPGDDAGALVRPAIILLGKWRKQANIPGRAATDPLAFPVGMPGVKVGQ